MQIIDGVNGLGEIPYTWNIPEIEGRSQRGEIALTLRILQAAGYDDDFYGHITVAQGDGTYLTNPWEIMWDDIMASDILVMDEVGRKLEGELSVTPGVNLHIALRRYVQGPEANVVIHQHPQYGTMWATRRQIPPIYEQGGAWMGKDVHLIPEADAGDMITEDHALGIARARCGILAGHGVLILGETLAEAAFRAVVLEHRAKRAWQFEGRSGVEELPDQVVDRMAKSLIGPRFAEKWWEAHLYREAQRHPEALLAGSRPLVAAAGS